MKSLLPLFLLAITLALPLSAQTADEPALVAMNGLPTGKLAAAETRSATPAATQDTHHFFNGADAPQLLGDYRGWRSRLAAQGLTFTGYWTGIASSNPVGGAKVGHTTTVDDTFIVADLDLQRLARMKKASLQMSFIDRGGRGLSNEYIGGQYNVQQCVGGQAPFFYQMFLQQALDDGKLVYKAGRFSASDDMNASPFYSLYLNNGFDGDIRNVLFDTQSSAYPFPTWGGYLRLTLGHNMYVKNAVFQTTAGVFDSSKHGIDWAVHNGDSVITMHEIAWTPTLAAGKEKKPLDGHYWLGGSYSPWTGFKQFLSTQTVGNSYGFYAHGDQMLYRKSAASKASTSLWTAAAYYPQQNISIVPLQINVGLVDQGRFGHRSEDKTIFGFLYGQFSRDYARSAVAAGKGNPSHEMVVELAHRIQLARHTFIQPDLQWDVRPAGTGRIPTAIVPGVEMGITF